MKEQSSIPCRFEFHDYPARNGYPGHMIAQFFVFDGTDNWRKEPTWNLPIDKASQAYLGSFEKTKAAFIERCKTSYALDVAGAFGRVMVPENFHLEFWTPEFIRKLAYVLDRPYKRSIAHDYLRLYLKMFWSYPVVMLSKMTAREMAAFVNHDLQLNPKVTPRAIRELAHNIGLKSKRPRGPRARVT